MTTTPPPSPEEFYISYPLYEKFTFSEEQSNEGWEVKYFEGSIDAYCPDCGSHSIFTRKPSHISYGDDSWAKDHLFDVTLTCSRDKKHQLYFIFKVTDRTIQKIGQFPSLATLNLYDARAYASVLNGDAFRELTKAIGLAAHGVGIGSFAYLRRIFEMLVEEAHTIAASSAEWDEERYLSNRMSDRILQLSAYLPKFLVENRLLYGILSKGIHELSEDECLKAFPVVKLGIEIILDAKIHEIAERKKLEQATRAIQGLHSDM